jgi:hypothetical protein
MVGNMRLLATPFVAAAPTGAHIRTRLRPSAADERVLRAVGMQLGGLAGQDLAARCHLGNGPDQRAARKRALTAAASSRWAGTITRTSNDQWKRGRRNLLDTRDGLRRASRTIQSRLAVPVGGRCGRVRGYASRAERFCKQGRLQHLEARLARVEARLAVGRVSVCRGGRRLAKLRHALDCDGVALTEAGWRGRWQAARLFLAADGEADKRWGNETIRVHPDEGWLEIRLPTPLAHLANTPGRAPTYRLGCPVTFGYRAHATAQAASGAVAYTIWLDAARGRWYLDASWRLAARPAPSLNELRQHPGLAVDLNADHLASFLLDPAGNPLGPPHTIPLDLDGQPSSTRNGRLRAAVAEMVRLAARHGCRSILVEDLDFADARQVGRERMGRGRRGKRLRGVVTNIPTRQFRDLLVGMAANAGLWVVAVDPAWTSVWGARYWQGLLNQQTKASVTVSRHDAAAVVIGRRGLGYRARRRGGCARVRPEDRARRAADSAGRPTTTAVPPAGRLVVPESAQGPGGPGGQRAGPQACKTRLPERDTSGDQAAQDRSVPPAAPSLTDADAAGTVRPGCS